MRKWVLFLSFLFLFLVSSNTSASGYSADEREALAAVQLLFDAMAAKDVAMAGRALAADSAFVSVRSNGVGERIARRTTAREFIAGLPDGPVPLLERMWDATVMVHGPIAMIWTPYDFYADGEFSHCGINVFNLLKSDSAWVITGGIYTVETGQCPESPLDQS